MRYYTSLFNILYGGDGRHRLTLGSHHSVDNAQHDFHFHLILEHHDAIMDQMIASKLKLNSGRKRS